MQMTQRRVWIASLLAAGCWIILVVLVINSVLGATPIEKYRLTSNPKPECLK
jgi:hypothetical protein